MSRLLGRFSKQRKILVPAILVVIVFFLVAVLAPLISPYDPNVMQTGIRLQPPSLAHPFGTDKFGRDILSRIIWGGRISIYVAAISVSLGSVIGTLIGMIAGYYGGKRDVILTRVIDAMFSFPDVFLGLVLMALLGIDISILMVAIGLVFTPQFARLARGHTLSIREKGYIVAARAAGESDFQILFYHVLPNFLSSFLVQATLAFGYAILYEAGFSFLGLGVQPPTASWGNMLAEARDYIDLAPWTVIFPGLAITIVVLCFNLIGDSFRDLLDPRSRA